MAPSPATFHILLALAEDDIHGYTGSKEVEEATAGAVVLDPATLYRTLRQLLTDGRIVEGPPDPEDSRRRAYRLIPRGRRVVRVLRDGHSVRRCTPRSPATTNKKIGETLAV